MSVVLMTALLLSGPVGGGLYRAGWHGGGHGGCESCSPYGGSYVPPVSLYEGRGRHNPARTCGMVRYTHRLGVHYSRPYDYRTLFDYPWHSRKPPCSTCGGGPAFDGETIVPEEYSPIEGEATSEPVDDGAAVRTPATEPTEPVPPPPAVKEPAPATKPAPAKKLPPAKLPAEKLPAVDDENPLPFDDPAASPFEDEKSDETPPPAAPPAAGPPAAAPPDGGRVQVLPPGAGPSQGPSQGPLVSERSLYQTLRGAPRKSILLQRD